MIKQKIATYSLLALSFVQIIGYGLDSKMIRGLGLVSMVSPLPLVFSTYRGLETFSLDFIITWKNTRGEVFTQKITSKDYKKLKGPYNIRNVYGAVLSYGAKFKSPEEIKLMKSVLRYGLCNRGPLSSDMKLDNFSSAVIRIIPKARGDNNKYQLSVDCNEKL